MKLVVVSDTHGDTFSLKKAIDRIPDADVVIHCGDGCNELEALKPLYPEKHFIYVRGNCDFYTDAENTQSITLEGKVIFITHGHLYNAKSGIYSLYCAAKEVNADLLLFGHTHTPSEEYTDGLYIVNPGSCQGYNGSFACIDLTPKGISVKHMKL